ncbi:conserved hypothetical protein [Trichinella spiralis]|uniref:hypothetical protein n=1 Tax=Trichinella spiralis TaxID=6334 RepID=UPI0001EFC721|nr:conserved hypothetical protein [Trichinella spiralis]
MNLIDRVNFDEASLFATVQPAQFDYHKFLLHTPSVVEIKSIKSLRFDGSPVSCLLFAGLFAACLSSYKPSCIVLLAFWKNERFSCRCQLAQKPMPSQLRLRVFSYHVAVVVVVVVTVLSMFSSRYVLNLLVFIYRRFDS